MENDIKSKVDRQNILNNSVAIKEAEKEFDIEGIEVNGVYYYTNQNLADFFEVDIRTIERILDTNKDELSSNDYKLLKGDELEKFKSFATDINVGHKTRNLGISTFRTLLNFAMLLSNSEKAKQVRSRMLDIVINVLVDKTGGYVKYINQRDKDYLNNRFIGTVEREKFKKSLNDFVDMGTHKYPYFTDKVYKAIFKENARKYKNMLSLAPDEQARDTMYSEVLLLIASFEAGLAYDIEKESQRKGRLLNKDEVNQIISDFSNHPSQKPFLNDARTKMASRDNCFRNVSHSSLTEYLTPVTQEEFENFIGEQSKSLEKQIEDHKDVFLRLKDK
ncbi:DNA-binding protein [Peptostreptococcus faecalis]|uniref:DNA-binding protein n=1 Tax=Peptostreptococcus faecalis TaxID=2045015 RepID=UPI000C7D13BB|nr:DNA-binding protein [Peptostreptococcus faecalis]